LPVIDRRENIIALGNSGTGKTHGALGLGLVACQKGLSVGFTTCCPYQILDPDQGMMETAEVSDKLDPTFSSNRAREWSVFS